MGHAGAVGKEQEVNQVNLAQAARTVREREKLLRGMNLYR